MTDCQTDKRKNRQSNTGVNECCLQHLLREQKNEGLSTAHWLRKKYVK